MCSSSSSRMVLIDESTACHSAQVPHAELQQNLRHLIHLPGRQITLACQEHWQAGVLLQKLQQQCQRLLNCYVYAPSACGVT